MGDTYWPESPAGAQKPINRDAKEVKKKRKKSKISTDQSKNSQKERDESGRFVKS